jgi:hypothetical protein
VKFAKNNKKGILYVIYVFNYHPTKVINANLETAVKNGFAHKKNTKKKNIKSNFILNRDYKGSSAAPLRCRR